MINAEFNQLAPAFQYCLAHDTVENRKLLHALLSGLTEIPHEWSALDARRFFMGKGEQGKAKYDFAGRSLLRDWPEPSVTLVCNLLVSSDSLYAETLRQQAIAEPSQPVEPEPLFENAQFVITEEADPVMTDGKELPRPRDVAFIEKLCAMLAERGV